MGLQSKGSGALPNVLEGAGAAMIGARGARTGELVDASSARNEELVDVEDEGVSVDGSEGGREQRGGPKVLLEGVPLKAALCQEGREGSLGLPRISVSWRVSSMTGALGGSVMKVEGDWKVLDE